MPYFQGSQRPFAGDRGNPQYQERPAPGPPPGAPQFASMPWINNPGYGGGGGQQAPQGMMSMLQYPQASGPPPMQMPSFNYTPPSFEAPTPPAPSPSGGSSSTFQPPSLTMPGGGGGGTVSSGVGQPPMPPMPMAQGMPGASAMPYGVQMGAQDNYQQAYLPMLMQLLAQYFPGIGGLQNDFQQARASSGLGWGGLGSGLESLLRDYYTQQLGNVLPTLGSFA